MYKGKIPFTDGGGLCFYAEQFTPQPFIWADNVLFDATLTFEFFERGRSAAHAVFKTSKGRRMSMFLVDLEEAIHRGVFNGGKITGKFEFCKRGQNYGVKLSEQEEGK